MKIVVLASAENDLEDGWHFYEEQEEGVGDEFFNSVLQGIRGLETDCHLHPSREGFHRMLIRKYHCGIYYTVEAGSVLVHRVLDLRRDPEWLRQQIKRSL